MQPKHRFAAWTAIVLAAACTACSGAPDTVQPTEPPAETAVTETAAATEPVTETAPETAAPAGEQGDNSEILSALPDTVWSGVNGENGAFAVGFDGDRITYVTQNGEVTEGWWTLRNDPERTIAIYSDSGMSGDPVRSVPLQYNLVKNVLRLEDRVYMVNTGETGAEAAKAEAAKLPAAADAYAQLKGCYWGGGDSAYALIFQLNEDGTCDMHYFDATDGIIDEAMFYWAMSSDTICFYNEDFAPVMHFDWKMDGPVFTLSDETTGNVVNCTKLPPDEASEVSRQLGVLAGAYDSEDGEGGDYGYNYEDYDVSVDP